MLDTTLSAYQAVAVEKKAVQQKLTFPREKQKYFKRQSQCEKC
jgi:hypothetical protein